MECRDSPGFRQPKPQSATSLPAGKEWVEQMLALEFRQSATGVGHSESGPVGPGVEKMPGLQHNPPPRGGRLEGVDHQCRQQNPQLCCVGDNRQTRREFLGTQLDPLLPGPLSQGCTDLPGCQGEVAGGGSRGGGTGEQHHVANHVADAERLGADGLQRQDPVRIGLAREQLLDIAGNGGDRIVDFMASPGGEFGEGPQLEIGQFVSNPGHQPLPGVQGAKSHPPPGVDPGPRWVRPLAVHQKNQPGGAPPPGWLAFTDMA